MVGNWGVGWLWIWPALIVVGLLMIGFAVVQLIVGGRLRSPAEHGPAGSPARRILDERYAHGEIGEDEYRRRRELLP